MKPRVMDPHSGEALPRLPRKRPINAAFAAAVLMAGLLPGLAHAQLSSDGGPIGYSADFLEFLEKQNILILTGNVDVIQNDARLQANKLTLYLADQGGNSTQSLESSDIDKILAEGDVHYVRAGQTARGDIAVYETKIDTVTFTGNVVVANRDNITRGDVLIMQISSGQARFNPGKVPGKRVQGRINPQRINPAAPGAPQ